MSVSESRAREVILARIRNGTADPDALFRSQPAPGASNAVPSAVTSADGSGIDLARTFGRNLEAVLGTYETAAAVAEVPSRIVERIEVWQQQDDAAEGYGSEVLSWGAETLQVPGLFPKLEELGVSLLVPGDLFASEGRARAASCSVGLTGVDAAFAGTGSMVLVSGPGKARAASLLPLHHIALVPIPRIYPTIEDWLAELRGDGRLAHLFSKNSQVAFVTGPSKSADIELNLTLGVHGPRHVHAIVYEDGR